MTNKIFPPWRNNRLPTDEDNALLIERNNEIQREYYTQVKQGEYWCSIKDSWFEGEWSTWSERIATPQECLDKDKEEGKIGRSISRKEALEIAKQSSIDAERGRAECAERDARPYLDDDCDKCEALEQALAKSEKRVKELEKACDCFSSKPGIRQELLYYKNQNILLKNVLRMEWGDGAVL